jgi:phenylacetate-CoA ligase
VAIEFRLRDFLDPMRILRMRSELMGNCRTSADALRSYSERKLAAVLRHAVASVPYYRSLGVTLDDDAVTSLRRFPVLSKTELRERAPLLICPGDLRKTWTVSTSGSSGASIDLMMDREANALEFVHYWRHWSWLGYRLGDRFVEFSSTGFMHHGRSREFVRRSRATNRFLVNTTSLDPSRARAIVDVLTRIRPRFLKGLASVLHLFAELAHAPRAGFPSLRAVYSNGETLTPGMRARIERFFGCRVVDGFGQMERVITICECEHASYHVMTDYGYPELLPVERDTERERGYSRLIATGLHNHVMPLIRYDTGDWVKGPLRYSSCPCGRPFPTVEGILGRASGSPIRISEDAWMPSAFFLTEGIPDVETVQFVQERVGELLIHVVASTDHPSARANIRRTLSERFSPWLKISVTFATIESLQRNPTGKTPTLVSTGGTPTV